MREASLKHAAVCYLVRENEGRTEVCLSKKKRGYGAGLYHGYGGMIELPETASQCAIRETEEESSVRVNERSLKRIAIVTTFAKSHVWRVHIFTCATWQGIPTESDENGPAEWFALDALPLEQMFPDRKYWLERSLRGELLSVNALLSEDGRSVHWEWDNDLVKTLEISMQ
jgi:8-oxo-dGTP diphosphatase